MLHFRFWWKTIINHVRPLSLVTLQAISNYNLVHINPFKLQSESDKKGFRLTLNNHKNSVYLLSFILCTNTTIKSQEYQNRDGLWLKAVGCTAFQESVTFLNEVYSLKGQIWCAMLTPSFMSNVHFQWQQLCHLNKKSKMNHGYNLFMSLSAAQIWHIKGKEEKMTRVSMMMKRPICR